MCACMYTCTCVYVCAYVCVYQCICFDCRACMHVHISSVHRSYFGSQEFHICYVHIYTHMTVVHACMCTYLLFIDRTLEARNFTSAMYIYTHIYIYACTHAHSHTHTIRKYTCSIHAECLQTCICTHIHTICLQTQKNFAHIFNHVWSYRRCV
jgi:hypothetical protein